MNPFITKVELSTVLGLPGDIFETPLLLGNGLNIISGENGTGKTLVLTHIKKKINDVSIVNFSDERSSRALIFNPKRNSEQQTTQLMVKRLREQGITQKKQIQEIVGRDFNDKTVVTYPSFGDLFQTQVQSYIGSGKVMGEDAMAMVVTEFNAVLERIFPSYCIQAIWEAIADQPSPRLTVSKGTMAGIPTESLSCGEREVLALVFNIFVSRNDVDVYLIDEPEIHLNWSLESQLFHFLAWFVKEHNKQAIVVSHSRAVFLKEFLSCTKFFGWKDDKISVTESVSEEIRNAIGGDSIQIIKSLEVNDKVFFVEDEITKKIVEELASIKTMDVSASVVQNSPNVKSLCRIAADQGMDSAVFLIDGDNEGAPSEFSSTSSFVMLRKYCIENYLLDFGLLGKIAIPTKTPEDVKTIVNDLVKADNDQANKAFQAMANTNMLVTSQDVLDTMDVSKLFKKGQLASKLGFSDTNALITAFIAQTNTDGRIDEIFSEITGKF